MPKGAVHIIKSLGLIGLYKVGPRDIGAIDTDGYRVPLLASVEMSHS